MGHPYQSGSTCSSRQSGRSLPVEPPERLRECTRPQAGPRAEVQEGERLAMGMALAAV